MASDLGAMPITMFGQPATATPVVPEVSGDRAIQAFDAAIRSEDLQLVQFQQTTATQAVGNNWTDLQYVRNTFGLDGKGQTVAIIDSGIAYDHVALGAGYGAGKKVVGGYDFAERDNNPYDDGPDGFHGTHVAGIVGSTHGTYTGVAPGVDLVALRVFDDNGGGYFSYVEQALQWVHTHRNSFANPITTVNLSLGTDWNSSNIPGWANLEDEFAQLKADGIFISVSAGNSFTDYNTPGLSYPAASPNVVGVMSTDSNGLLSYFSQRHSTAIAAPGRSIMSTVPDHAFGADGVKNDFGSASGTSMSAPYIAGASALVRQAMTAFGMPNISQTSIYQHLRNTADTFFDSATNANYLRVNVQRAITQIAAGDLQGNTAAAAYSVGTWSGTTALAGKFNTLTDQDYFSFTADRSGVMKLNINSLGGGTTTWTVVGGNSTSTSSVNLNVVAGQTYTFGVSSSAVGSYSITTNFTGGNTGGTTDGGGTNTGGGTNAGAAVAWGKVDVRSIDNLSVNGSASFTFQASRSAYFTLDAYQSQGSAVKLEFLTSQGTSFREATLTTGVGRLNFYASEGEQYTLRITGSTTDLDVRMLNIISRSGSELIVNGTSDADQVTVFAQQQKLVINGMLNSYAGLNTVTIIGNGGEDAVVVLGDQTATEQVTLNSTSLTVSGGNTTIKAADVEAYILRFQDADSSTIYDGRGNDVFWIADSYVGMRGTGYAYRTFGFGYNVVNATAGGNDVGYFYDTAGNPDLNQVHGTVTTATSAGKLTVARGIERGFYVANNQIQDLATYVANTQTKGALSAKSTDLAVNVATTTPLTAIGFAITSLSTTDTRVDSFETTTRQTAVENLDDEDGFDLQASAILDSIAELSGMVDKFRRTQSEVSADYACHEAINDDIFATEDMGRELLFGE